MITATSNNDTPANFDNCDVNIESRIDSSCENQNVAADGKLGYGLLHEQLDFVCIAPIMFRNQNANHNDFEMIEQANLPLYNPPSLKSIALERLKSIPQSVNIPEVAGANESNKQTRKRKRGSKKAVAKTLRNMGLQYTSSSTKHRMISERKMSNSCRSGCRLKCSYNISEEERIIVFKSYWKMGSLPKQRDYISKHMTEVKPKYQYKKQCNNRKPQHAFYLTINNQKKKVCKIFF